MAKLFFIFLVLMLFCLTYLQALKCEGIEKNGASRTVSKQVFKEKLPW